MSDKQPQGTPAPFVFNPAAKYLLVDISEYEFGTKAGPPADAVLDDEAVVSVAPSRASSAADAVGNERTAKTVEASGNASTAVGATKVLNSDFGLAEILSQLTAVRDRLKRLVELTSMALKDAYRFQWCLNRVRVLYTVYNATAHVVTEIEEKRFAKFETGKQDFLRRSGRGPSANAGGMHTSTVFGQLQQGAAELFRTYSEYLQNADPQSGLGAASLTMPLNKTHPALMSLSTAVRIRALVDIEKYYGTIRGARDSDVGLWEVEKRISAALIDVDISKFEPNAREIRSYLLKIDAVMVQIANFYCESGEASRFVALFQAVDPSVPTSFASLVILTKLAEMFPTITARTGGFTEALSRINSAVSFNKAKSPEEIKSTFLTVVMKLALRYDAHLKFFEDRKLTTPDLHSVTKEILDHIPSKPATKNSKTLLTDTKAYKTSRFLSSIVDLGLGIHAVAEADNSVRAKAAAGMVVTAQAVELTSALSSMIGETKYSDHIEAFGGVGALITSGVSLSKTLVAFLNDPSLWNGASVVKDASGFAAAAGRMATALSARTTWLLHVPTSLQYAMKLGAIGDVMVAWQLGWSAGRWFSRNVISDDTKQEALRRPLLEALKAVQDFRPSELVRLDEDLLLYTGVAEDPRTLVNTLPLPDFLNFTQFLNAVGSEHARPKGGAGMGMSKRMEGLSEKIAGKNVSWLGVNVKVDEIRMFLVPAILSRAKPVIESCMENGLYYDSEAIFQSFVTTVQRLVRFNATNLFSFSVSLLTEQEAQLLESLDGINSDPTMWTQTKEALKALGIDDGMAERSMVAVPSAIQSERERLKREEGFRRLRESFGSQRPVWPPRSR